MVLCKLSIPLLIIVSSAEFQFSFHELIISVTSLINIKYVGAFCGYQLPFSCPVIVSNALYLLQFTFSLHLDTV